MNAPDDSGLLDYFARGRSVIVPADSATKSERLGKLMDDAYDEYCQLENKGHAPEPHSFCARFPDVHSSLARLLRLHQYLDVNSEVMPEADEPHWPKTGAEIAGFQLIRELGRGAFSRVYQATETALGGRLVALKVSLIGNAEAAMLGPLDHEAIVSAHSVQWDDATELWIVCMPYRGSATLFTVLYRLAEVRSRKETLRGRHFFDACQDPFAPQANEPASDSPPREADFADVVRRLTLQIARALAFLHAKGVHHRDIKPSNILLRSDGMPLLLDFNLSAHVQHRADNRLGGTPLYMAPEQIEATWPGQTPAAALDARADLFSLGVVLYELASGKHPFGQFPSKVRASDLGALLTERHRQGAPSLRKVCPTLDANLALAIDQCLAIDPAARPASAQEIVDRLNRPLPWRRRAARYLARRPKIAFASLFLLAAFTVFVAFQFREQTTQDLFQTGKDAFASGNFDQAKHFLNQALHREPKNVDALLLRGKAYVRLKDFHSANADFLQADKLRPDGVCKAWRAYCFQKLREPLAARPLYEAALGDGLETAEVLNNLGALYFEGPPVSFALSEKKLLAARNENPKLRAVSHNLAKLFLKKALLAPQGQKHDFQQKAVDYIEDAYALALATGEVTTELLFDCASVHAFAAAKNPASIPAAAKFIRFALAGGQDPNRFTVSTFDAVRAEVDALRAARPLVETVATNAVRVLEPTRN